MRNKNWKIKEVENDKINEQIQNIPSKIYLNNQYEGSLMQE